jgi:hypothetical protein
MAVVFSGTKVPQSEIEEIQMEIYADWGTFRDADVDINEGHKSGADVYESKVSVNMLAHTTGEVAAGSDVLGVQKSVVNLTKIMFADTVNYETLLDTRFERSMQAGAFNTVSSEFDNKVLQQVSPAIAQTMESVSWDGATTAQKALIAGLTPGAAQGSISAGAQTLAAAMPTNLVNSLPAIILHNDSQSKDTPGAGLGDYKKVLNIATITSSTIAAEYAKLYATLDPKVLAMEEVIIYAPLAHRQLMKIANNSVGAASNQNFLFEGDKASYNGVEVKFKPLVGFMIASPAKYLKILMDLASDVSHLETGKMANGSEEYFYKNVQAYATWCTNQRYITLYGG